MPSNCAVATCNSWTKGPKKRADHSLSFFRFPKDLSLRSAWVRLCARKDWFNPDNSAICSLHFTQLDYDPSYLAKKKFMPSVKPRLKPDAIPSKNIHSHPTCKHESRAQRLRQRKTAREVPEALQAADEGDHVSPAPTTASAPTSSQQSSPQDRSEAARERQEWARRPAAGGAGGATDAAYPEERRKTCQEERRERQERRDRKELVERLLAEHEHGEKEQSDPANVSDPAPMDDDSEEDEVVPSPAVAAANKLKTFLTARPGRRPTILGLRRSSPVHSTHRQPLRHNYSTLERTKEILQLRLKVRKLEAKCLRLLGGAAVPQGAAGGVGDKVATGEEKAAGGGGGDRRAESQEGLRTGETAATAIRDLGEEPLVILRNDRSAKIPSFLRHMQSSQLSDSMATSMPSDLQEALEANHLLKVQLLNLQAVMLKWAMANKKLHSTNPKEEEEEENEESASTVRGPRLRQLLQLEAAVKAMFTEAQIRAIVREHEDSSGAIDKHRKHQWGEEDLRRMLELRAISSDKVIKHVREKMKIPLPTLRTARIRCRKSPKLSEVYKEMLRKREENQNLCSMCERQVNAIDRVIDAADKPPDPESDEDSPFGRQFVQRVPRPSQDPADVRPKKRRRAAVTAEKEHRAAVTADSQKRKKRQGAASLDWDTSDSDAELSDPGMWGQIPSSRISWQPEVLRDSTPPDRTPLGLFRPHSYGYGYGSARR